MAPYQGHCNCGSIKVTLSNKPESIIVCHWYEVFPPTHMHVKSATTKTTYSCF